MEDSNIGFTNHKMQFYYHITYRIFQLSVKMGLTKFDPFTLACYHTIIMGMYAVSILGIFKSIKHISDSSQYVFSLIMAITIILSNYFVIKKIGEAGLKINYRSETKIVSIGLDILMICYVVFAFVLINFVRSKNAL